MKRGDGRGGRPVPVGAALQEWLDDAGLGRRLELTRALERWAGAVGPQIAAVTRPESVNGQGVLWVKVVSSPWANELSLMTPRILSQLNRLAPRDAQIREIRWLVGQLDAPDPR
jgi:predicted nucleic acid-binding Zn ribbon protein